MKFSIIIPTCNSLERKKFSIKLILAQLFKQSHRDFEIICVDAASTDSTTDYLAALESQRENFSLLALTHRSSRSEARNAGSAAAAGKILVFMDDDCLLLRHDIFELLETVRAPYFAAGAQRKWFPVTWKSNQISPLLESNDYSALDSMTVEPRGIDRVSGHRDLLEYSFISHFGLIGKDLFDELGGFDEEYRGWGYEDTDLMMRAHARAGAFTCLYEKMTVYHLTHPVPEADFVNREANEARYRVRQEKLAMAFSARRLFGIELDGTKPVSLDAVQGSKTQSHPTPISGISCVIPTRNSFRLKKGSLQLALEAISRAHLSVPIEVLVVSTSEDETDAYLESLGNRIGNIPLTHLRHPKKNDRSSARNLGAKNARHDLLLFMDDDVLVLEPKVIDWIAAQMKPGTFACGAKRYWLPIGWDRSFVENALRGNPRLLLRQAFLPSGINRETGFRDLREFSFVANFGFIFREDFFRVGAFDAANFPARKEDNDLMFRCLLNSFDYLHLYDHCSLVHLTHPMMGERPTERWEYHLAFQEVERKRGFLFKPNHLFGVFEMDGTAALEPISEHPSPRHGTNGASSQPTQPVKHERQGR